MVHIWKKGAGEPWVAIQLSGKACAIASGNSLREYKRPATVTGARPTLVAFQGAAGQENWALLSSAGTEVRVNGASMCLGLHVLRDRDAIQVRDRRSGPARLAPTPSDRSNEETPWSARGTGRGRWASCLRSPIRRTDSRGVAPGGIATSTVRVGTSGAPVSDDRAWNPSIRMSTNSSTGSCERNSTGGVSARNVKDRPAVGVSISYNNDRFGRCRSSQLLRS